MKRRRPFLVALRWVLHTRRNRRWVAKRLCWCAGYLSRIKTYTRFYTLDLDKWEETGELPASKPTGRHWSPCALTFKVMGLAMQLDWVCWDHWALDHAGHETVTCPECGDQMHVDEDDEPAEEPVSKPRLEQLAAEPSAWDEEVGEFAPADDVFAALESIPGINVQPAPPHDEERRFTLPNGTVLYNVHPKERCTDWPCVIHNPTDHHMRDWRLHWRDDRGIFERLCPNHGTGHPDPDQFDYWRSLGEEWQGIHGCCGCCGEPT